jgi:hypothetical protein
VIQSRINATLLSILIDCSTANPTGPAISFCLTSSVISTAMFLYSLLGRIFYFYLGVFVCKPIERTVKAQNINVVCNNVNCSMPTNTEIDSEK